MRQSSFSGAQYLSKGLTLIWQPGVRAFVIIPLLINILLLTIATIFAFNWLSEWFQGLHQSEWAIIRWTVENLGWLIWPLSIIGVFVVVFFIFSFLANWIAAPFNGLLSEAVERNLAGNTYQQDSVNLKDFFADIPRLMSREWQKLKYYLPRAIGCLLLFFIIGPLAPVVWFIFNSWMSAIQYIDYPMDNHKVPFGEMLSQIKQNRSSAMSFGLVVMFLTMIPVVNIFLMPVAVAGATNLWFDQFRD
jgi:CysZ protein